MTGELWQTLGVEVFGMVRRIVPGGKRVPGRLSENGRRSSCQGQDTLELLGLITLQRSIVNYYHVAAFGAAGTL